MSYRRKNSKSLEVVDGALDAFVGLTPLPLAGPAHWKSYLAGFFGFIAIAAAISFFFIGGNEFEPVPVSPPTVASSTSVVQNANVAEILAQLGE